MAYSYRLYHPPTIGRSISTSPDPLRELRLRGRAHHEPVDPPEDHVTLELDLALGFGEKAFAAIDPARTQVDEVPSDLRGLDRIQYGSYAELGSKLETPLGQEVPL